MVNDCWDVFEGKGYIKFFVTQHTKEDFEIEVLDYSGCAEGMQDTLGIEYVLKDMWCLDKDPDFTFREGVTYTINDLTVQWTRGEGWQWDDGAEYEFVSISSDATLIGYLTYKAKMIWWRQVQCRLKILKKRISDAE